MTDTHSGLALDGVGTPIVIASHERSGTHLTIDLVRRQFRAAKVRKRIGETPHATYFSIDRFFPGRRNRVPEADAVAMMQRAERPVIKTHAFPDLHEVEDAHRAFCAEVLARGALLYAVRDPRRVLCSMHAYAQFRPEARVPIHAWLDAPGPDGLTPATHWAQHVQAWADRPGVLVVRYEDVVAEPEASIRRIAEHIGLEPMLVRPLLPKPMRGELGMLRMRLAIDPRATNISAKRVPTPKASDVFDDEHEARLIDEAGAVMARFGYTTPAS